MRCLAPPVLLATQVRTMDSGVAARAFGRGGRTVNQRGRLELAPLVRAETKLLKTCERFRGARPAESGHRRLKGRLRRSTLATRPLPRPSPLFPAVRLAKGVKGAVYACPAHQADLQRNCLGVAARSLVLVRPSLFPSLSPSSCRRTRLPHIPSFSAPTRTT